MTFGKGDIVRLSEEVGEGFGIVLAVRNGTIGGVPTRGWTTTRQGVTLVTAPRSDEVLVHGLLTEAYGWFSAGSLDLVSGRVFG